MSETSMIDSMRRDQDLLKEKLGKAEVKSKKQLYINEGKVQKEKKL